MRRNKLFILIGIFWLILIIGFITTKEFTLRTGKEVLLKTVPVDPRDLFRGDYVILRYEISRLDLNNIAADYTDFKIGDRVYLALNKEDGCGVASRIFRNTPRTEKLFLKGIVKNVRDKNLTIEYGIESYFVPEGKGKEIERLRAGKKLEVRVSVDKFGNLVIKSLLIDGKEIGFK